MTSCLLGQRIAVSCLRDVRGKDLKANTSPQIASLPENKSSLYIRPKLYV